MKIINYRVFQVRNTGTLLGKKKKKIYKTTFRRQTRPSHPPGVKLGLGSPILAVHAPWPSLTQSALQSGFCCQHLPVERLVTENPGESGGPRRQNVHLLFPQSGYVQLHESKTTDGQGAWGGAVSAGFCWLILRFELGSPAGLLSVLAVCSWQCAQIYLEKP